MFAFQGDCSLAVSNMQKEKKKKGRSRSIHFSVCFLKDFEYEEKKH